MLGVVGKEKVCYWLSNDIVGFYLDEVGGSSTIGSVVV